MKFIEYLRKQFIDGSGWDKMGRECPTDDWADECINEMTNVELVETVESWLEERQKAK